VEIKDLSANHAFNFCERFFTPNVVAGSGERFAWPPPQPVWFAPVALGGDPRLYTGDWWKVKEEQARAVSARLLFGGASARVETRRAAAVHLAQHDTEIETLLVMVG
jgi:hypothetical protein